MPGDDIHQPNDKLLKSTFSIPENARGFFENHLPKPLAAAIDLARPATIPRARVAETGQKRFPII
jgi:hypothetical protein